MGGKIMKLTSLFAFLSVLLQCASSAKQPLAWSELDIAAISRMSPHQLELLAEGLAAEELIRAKRSGSVQNLAQIASKSSSGFSSKLGLLGQASAGASSFIGSASSKGDEQGYHYDPPETPKYDFWTLKKSILNTLFQAVKAITGGVTILKGQLIKGGGALASVAGKVISGKGEAVTNLGKKIVNSAHLSPPKKHHISVPPPAHYGAPPLEYIPATAYGPPSAPALQYGVPSAPSGPSKYTAHYEALPHSRGYYDEKEYTYGDQYY